MMCSGRPSAEHGEEITQFSDIDLSQPACNSLWRPVKEKANLIAAKNDGYFCDFCLEQMRETWLKIEKLCL